MANTTNTRLPDSEYAAVYPYNAVQVSRAGHEFHVDDTPGAERIRQAHKSGTFFEVSADGRKVELVVGDNYQYIKGGLTLTIDNNGDILCSGNMRMVVQGDMYAEVHGSLTSVVSGDSTTATLGDSVNMVGGNCLAKVEGTMSTKVDGNLNATVGGDAELDIGGDLAVVSQGDVDINAANIRLSASEFLTLQGTNVNVVKGIYDVSAS